MSKTEILSFTTSLKKQQFSRHCENAFFFFFLTLVVITNLVLLFLF